jgi:predicted nucleic acid-binding protein
VANWNSILDTSALARYYRREPGSDFVERVFLDAGAQRVISRLAMVEMESAVATKASTGETDGEAALMARRRLEPGLGTAQHPDGDRRRRSFRDRKASVAQIRRRSKSENA